MPLSSFALSPIQAPDALSAELALQTRLLRDDVIYPELMRGDEQIRKFYQGFKECLDANLTEKQFADFCAQTITCGLFVARVRGGDSITRQTARLFTPSLVGALRDIFRFISQEKLPPRMELVIDNIVAILNAANIQSVLKWYCRQGKNEDPTLRFYETFLAEYDPTTRRQRGVYYTPRPVVSYIVRGVHDLLKTRFDLTDGLADPAVRLIDPAAGTLAFPIEAIRLAFDEFVSKYGENKKVDLLHNHILPHFCAFELLIPPYLIGHIKISLLLDELGLSFPNDKQFQFYLANALEAEIWGASAVSGLFPAYSKGISIPWSETDQTVLVVVGNPPYSKISANQNPWIKWLLNTNADGAQSYCTIDGRPLKEKGRSGLYDDYVKFLRLAQWRVQRAGRGIVALITNHGYLDNPTFCGMRQSLLQTFDEIYFLDLHGNAKRREKKPDGSKDENVFEILQGVAVGFFIKHGNPNRRGVYCFDLYGKREEKYHWLETHTIETTEYRPIVPTSPNYFFVRRQTENQQNYFLWPSIAEIFPLNATGIVTGQDAFVCDFDRDALLRRIECLRDQSWSDDRIRATYNLKDTHRWKLAQCRVGITKAHNWQDYALPCLYRPFDIRWLYYHPLVITDPRLSVMCHMTAGNNLALVSAKGNKSWTMNHFLVTDKIIERKCGERTTGARIFPLYVYPSATMPELLSATRRPNLTDNFLDKIASAYGFSPAPEEVLAYIYAVFYSPTYRRKYVQEMRMDFPRVPFTADANLFREMAALGQQLIDLHLLRSPALHQPQAYYYKNGNSLIRVVRYNAAQERVYINPDEYFEGIAPEVWTYQIGGYRVLENYLKVRKGRFLDDPAYYIRVVTAIKHTVGIQDQIDLVYSETERSFLR